MPVGVVTNVLAVAAGGAIGAFAGNLFSQKFKESLNMVFGVCAMTMGISSIGLMENMPAVIFAVIIGTSLGLAAHLGEWINRGGQAMQKAMSRFVKPPENGMSEEEFSRELITIIVLFCASGTGIYGSIVSGMSGDHSILISKSILDLFTALIFACSLGAVVCVVAVPQLVIFLLLYFAAGMIYPLTTPVMISDFKAAGGVLLLATGFRMLKLKDFPVADMIPAMILAMPASWLWTNAVLPMLG